MHDLVGHYDVCSLGVIAGIAFLFVQGVERHFPLYHQVMRRFMVVGFLATVSYGYYDAKPAVESELLGLIILALAASQAAALIALIVVPPVVSVRDTLCSWSRSWRLAAERRAEERRKAEEKRRRELEWERSRPERERQEREWEAKRQAEAAAQKRRDDARAECLLYFHLHAPEFSKRFSRPQYDEYVKTYMGDNQPPEEVERRAQRLLGLMEGHLEKAGARAQQLDLAALAKWYQDARAQIEALAIDPRSKHFQLGKLHQRYAELVQEHLEGLKP
jgi:hypothetical protein